MEKIRKEERKGCLQVSGLKAPAIVKAAETELITNILYMLMEDKVITEAEYKKIVNKDMGKQYGTGK